jgi:hypothetical protein
VENQEVTLNDVQRALCQKYHLVVKADAEGFTVIDRDPVLRAKKVKLPSHSGTDLNALIFKARRAQEVRHGTIVEPEAVEPEAVEPEAVTPTWQEPVTAEEIEAANATLAEVASNVVPMRRAVLTPEELAPDVLTNVILDDTGKKVAKAKKEAKHRPNRLARAFRAIIENPTMTIAEQAAIADVTVDMLGYYEILLRSVFNIIYEKHGDDVIPMLPKLNK